MNKPLKGVLVASAVASLLASAAFGADKEAPKKDAKAGGDVHCAGVNECKGKGACSGAGNSCAGKNGCKGKGWVAMADADCKAKGGKVATEEKKGK